MITVLAIATVFMIVVSVVGAGRCRSRWAQFSVRVKWSLTLGAAMSVGTYVAMLATRWRSASPLAGELLGSLAVGAYSLLVLLLTLFRPKPLFYGLVFVLLLALPIALVWLPLAASSQGPIRTEHITADLYFDKVHWDAGAMGSSGTTLLIYRRPSQAPFIEHDLQRVVFDDAKCESDGAFIVLQTDGRHALARCPWHEYDHRQGYHDFLVPLF